MITGVPIMAVSSKVENLEAQPGCNAFQGE